MFDGQVNLFVCVHVYSLVAANDMETFGGFHEQPTEAFLSNDMVDLSWHLGCAFGRDEPKDVVKMTQTYFVKSLVYRFDINFKTETPPSVEYDLGPNILDKPEDD